MSEHMAVILYCSLAAASFAIAEHAVWRTWLARFTRSIGKNTLPDKSGPGNRSFHKPSYYHRHPERPIPPKFQAPDKSVDGKLVEFLESNSTLTVIFLAVGVVGMYFPWVLIILLLILQIEFQRKRVVSGLGVWKQLAAHLALFIVAGCMFWIAHRWFMENEIARAYIYIEDMTVTQDPFITIHVAGRAGGKEVLLAVVRSGTATTDWGTYVPDSELRQRLFGPEGGL